MPSQCMYVCMYDQVLLLLYVMVLVLSPRSPEYRISTAFLDLEWQVNSTLLQRYFTFYLKSTTTTYIGFERRGCSPGNIDRYINEYTFLVNEGMNVCMHARVCSVCWSL